MKKLSVSLVIAMLFLCGLVRADEEVDILYPLIIVNGEIRVRPEYRNNEDFDKNKDDNNAFVASRTRLGLNVEVGEKFGAFIQAQHTMTWGSELLTSQGSQKVYPVQGTSDLTYTRNFYNALDLHQSYIIVKDLLISSVSLKIGRQEINYGDQRLVGSFGWSNNGRAFDSMLLNYKWNYLNADIFGAKVIESDNSDNDTDFAGAHIILKRGDSIMPELNAYTFYKRDSSGPSTALELWTGGARANFTGIQSLAVTAEGAYQFGRKDQRRIKIRAFAGAVKARYASPFIFKPTVIAEYDIASGDKDGSDNKYQTFDNLYPTNHPHYGYMDYAAWKNMQDIRAGIGFQPFEKVSASVDYHMLSLYTNKDNWYRASGAVMMPTDGAAGRALGNEIDVSAKINVINDLNLEAGYSRFFRGKFIEDIKGDSAADSDWAYVIAQVNF